MNNLINHVVKLFSAPSVAELAVRELKDAKRRLLEIQSTVEYATRMSEYHKDRITRLTDYLGLNNDTPSSNSN